MDTQSSLLLAGTKWTRVLLLLHIWLRNTVINNLGEQKPHKLLNDTIFTHIKQIHSNKDVGNFNMAQRDVEIDFMS